MPHLTPLMNTIWAFTVLANISLALILIGRNFYIRYPWLTISTILSIVLDAFFAYLRFSHPHFHSPYRSAIFFLFLVINGMIIVEAWSIEDKVVQVPIEIQTIFEIIGLLLKKAGMVWIVYYLECALRLSNLLIIVLFLIVFAKRRLYERTE